MSELHANRCEPRPSRRPVAGDTPPLLFATRHVGIVQSVKPDGSLTTVEGHASNAVSVEHRSPSEAASFVRL